MPNVGVVFDLSERAEQETYALLDLDGDGTAVKLLLRSRMAQAVNEVDHSPLDPTGEYPVWHRIWETAFTVEYYWH